MSNNSSNTRRARKRRAVTGQPGAPAPSSTFFVQVVPSAPSKIHRRLSHEARAALLIGELQAAPGGKSIIKLLADGHMTITEYDSIVLRSRVVADAARGALTQG
jgi:hypothetical protein